MNKYNVLYIFVDSVRRYHSDSDDRGKLDFMDEFAKEAIEFPNVVTSAPSTYMSISAMMSGMPSYYVNRNFSDFMFDKNAFPSLPQILETHGYNIYNFWMSQESRETMISLLPIVDRKHWPRNYKHRDWWNNKKINTLVENTLPKVDKKKPTFFFVNYNCRLDPETGDTVKECLKLFREHGYTEDNTITVLCSDHGYPDPSKETSNPSFYLLNNVGHDLVLTDDNIMIPFSIQIPNYEKGVRVDTTISSIDIFPTILDILGIEKDNRILGKSFLNYIAKPNSINPKFHRTDSRLAFQKGRGTAIRNDKYKYIYYHDNFFEDLTEEFFDLINDPMENTNLIDSSNPEIQEQIAIFRQEFTKSENDAMSFQIDFLFTKLNEHYKTKIKESKNLLIIGSARPLFINLITQLIKKINATATLHVLDIESEKAAYKHLDNIIPCNDLNVLTQNEINTIVKNENIDLIFIPINTNEKRDNKKLYALFQQISCETLFIDYNMEKVSRTFLGHHIRKFIQVFPLIKYEPLSLVKYFTTKIKYLLARNKK